MKYEKLTFDRRRPMSHVITVPTESSYGVGALRYDTGDGSRSLFHIDVNARHQQHVFTK